MCTIETVPRGLIFRCQQLVCEWILVISSRKHTYKSHPKVSVTETEIRYVIFRFYVPLKTQRNFVSIWQLESNEKTFKNQCSITLRNTFLRFRSHSDRLKILKNEAFSGYFCLEKNKKVHVICKYGIDQIERMITALTSDASKRQWN